MSSVSERCCLCFKKSEKHGDDLIWRDSLQLCPKCYERYTESAYNQRVMMINSIKAYRKLITRYEDVGTIIIDCDFEGIS